MPKRSILRPLAFLIYIYFLSNVKLFAYHKSLLSVTHDVNESARELNDDLTRISN